MIDPELKNLLQANYELAKQNNDLLMKMHKAQRLERIMRVIYWIIIIGIAIGALYYIQPYIHKLEDLWPRLTKVLNNIPGFSSLTQ